jgi:hypothetical protein
MAVYRLNLRFLRVVPRLRNLETSVSLAWSRVRNLTLQFCIFCILSVLGLEMAARLLLPERVAVQRAIYFPDGRYGFVSKGALANKAGYVNFRPDSTIRVIAYYPVANGNPTLEYDCTYRSDRLGFVSNAVDYQAADILLLGDSYAQGDGGCEWMSRLDPVVRSKIYSTAVMGLGVLHWSHIVSDMKKLKKPTKILIVFITDDFFRTDWVYSRAQLECVNGRGDCSGGTFWDPISANLSEVAAKRRAERTTLKGLKRFIQYHLIATYSVYKSLKDLKYPSPEQGTVFLRSLSIISDLAREYDVKLLWANEKSDIDFSRAEAKAVARGLSGLKVSRCKIPSEDFMPRDAHPNAAGYDLLKACVERVVQTW